MHAGNKIRNKRRIPITFITIGLLSGSLLFALKDNTGLRQTECRDADKNARIECYQKNIKGLLATKGIDIALGEVSRLAEEDKDFSPFCHDFMHEVGQAAYQEFSDNRSFELSPKITMCSYGFYHGFMETLWQKTGSYTEANEFCGYINTKLEAQGLNIDSECYHGIGHGIVLAHDPRLLGDAHGLTKQALDICVKVNETEQHQVECATGVFNGIANAYNSGEFGLTVDKEQPLRICFQQSDLFKAPCYGFMARVLLASMDYDLKDATLAADDVEEYAYKRSVILNLANIYAAGKTSAELLTACKGIAAKWQGSCFNGAAIGLFQNSGPGGNNYQKPFDFCQSGILNSAEQADCLASLAPDIYKFYGTTKAREICGKLNGQHRDKCLNYGA